MQRLIDHVKHVLGWIGAATSVDSPYINVGKADKVQIVLAVTVTSGTAAGAVALAQATTAAGGSAKALAFTKMFYVADMATSDTPVETAVTSNTFNAGGVEAKRQLYVIEVEAEQLDVTNGFKFLRATVADITNGVVALDYVAYGLRHGGVSSAPTLLS